MKFLLDENLLPSFRDILRDLGYEAYYAYDVGLAHTPDEDIVSFARRSGHIILTNDLDFSRIMVLSRTEFPSVVTFRLGALNHEFFREIVLLNFSSLADSLGIGSLVTIDDRGIRMRKLPIF